jgi:hypothetical protein
MPSSETTTGPQSQLAPTTPEFQWDNLSIAVLLDDVVKEVNKKFFVVEEYGGKCVVAWQEPDALMGGRLKFEIQTFNNFTNRYTHQQIPIAVSKNGAVRSDSRGKIWLEHRRRRQYLKVVFAPGAKQDPSIFNLWKGFAYQPLPGNCSLLLAHLQSVICRDNPMLYEYLLNWMARAVQSPGERGHVALVFKGKKGSGKSLVADYFGALFGSHYLAVSQGSQVTGNFNSHLRDLCVLACNEAFFAGDPRQVGPLKALITDPTIAIEQKFVDVVNVPNTLHFLVTTNEEWSIPATVDERRFCYFEVSDEMCGDAHYFDELCNERDNGGYSALLDFLLKRDISKFEPRLFPKTEGLRRQMAQSLSPVEAAWFECLVSGALPALVFRDGSAHLRSEVFIRWAAEKNKRWVFGDEKLSNLFAIKSRRALGSDSMGFQKDRDKSGGRRRFWKIPSLAECRKAWNSQRFDYDWSLAEDDAWEGKEPDEPFM